MSRTMYESQNDLENERAVINECAQRWHCTAKKLPAPPYKIDWLLFRGGPMAWAEVKCRNQFYDPYRIGVHKFYELTNIARCTGLKALVIVRWRSKGIYWIDVSNGEHDGVQWMADRRQREPADAEPSVELAFSRFHALNFPQISNNKTERTNQ